MKDNAKTGRPLVEKANAAFVRASWKAIEVARRTGMPVIIWENGRMSAVPAEEMAEW